MLCLAVHSHATLVMAVALQGHWWQCDAPWLWPITTIIVHYSLHVCCSVFFVGYTVTNVCGGYLAARYTAKLVLGLGVLSYSVFTILMPVAASSKSVYVVLACACLMGAGEGVVFPAIQHLQGKWLPPKRRTFANTLLFAGIADLSCSCLCCFTELVCSNWLSPQDWYACVHMCALLSLVRAQTAHCLLLAPDTHSTSHGRNCVQVICTVNVYSAPLCTHLCDRTRSA